MIHSAQNAPQKQSLRRLSGMERQKVEAKLTELYAAIAEFRAILADEGRIKQIIIRFDGKFQRKQILIQTIR